MNKKRSSLPYMDNWKAILLTALINLASTLVFQFSEGRITRSAVIRDSLICGVLTVIIDVAVVYVDMKRRRARGLLPANVPVSARMQRLPKNPALLALVYMPISAAVIALINWGVMALFGIESFGRWNWLVYKLLYACLLSAKIIEYCIFRFVQPDWAGEARAIADANVKNPLPKISTLKEMYASISANIAMNMIIGTALGGAVVGEGQTVLIYPTYASGIWVTGLIFGFLTGVLLTRGVLGAIKQLIAGDALPQELPPPDCRLCWLPKSDLALTAVVCAAIMTMSVVLLPLQMWVLGVSVMNFYQFCILITAYGSFVGHVFSKLLTARCLQSDYVAWVRASNVQRGA